jgi:glycine cleavage system H lipoate-binding protein
MSDLINVKAPNEHCSVCLWHHHPDYPSGEVYVTSGMVVTVALTDEVQQRLATGRIVQTDEPATEPIAGYDTMSVEAISAAMATMGGIERIIVRQYEAANQKRASVLNSEPDPLPGYDQMNVAGILSTLANATPEAWSAVTQYEATHKNRKSIIEAHQAPVGG